MFPSISIPNAIQRPTDGGATPAVSGPTPADGKAVLVPGMVAQRAAASPNSVAVVSDSESLTYKDLDCRANQLAQHLQSLGFGPAVVVGICLPRSARAVIAALAVLKSGGSYLPLDLSSPPERLSFILNDARPAVLITESNSASRFGRGSWAVVDLDRDSAEISRKSFEQPVPHATAEDLAYVIYTSGSTGQPKGVQITHASLSNLVQWHLEAFSVTSADRVTQLASLGFDAAVWETWPCLAAGAGLYLVPEVTRLSAELLRDWLVAQKITVSFAPTPLAERMITLEWPQDISLRFLLTGADILHHYPPQNLSFRLVNNYGPTEATVVTTSGTVLPDQRPDVRPAIGWPITHATVHILDKELREVPPGTVGEIYIGGAGVARGYLNHPELTAERFISDPFSAIPGARLYRTGDLARMLPDGQIAYLGRTDDQIKVRGFRIEPNEIVTLLDSHPAVRASAVVGRKDSFGMVRLLAYVVADGREVLGANELRTLLRAQLPDYMVPVAFIRMEELPVNANGKLDREALPEPSADNTLGDEEFAAPRTPLERRVTAIIASLLGLQRVSVTENFFLIGGHSLLGTQLIARLRDTFGIELSLRSIFDLPTPAQLAQEVERLMVARLDAMSADEIHRALHQARAIEGAQ
jgi:amino acid adenylation domain-containing protein